MAEIVLDHVVKRYPDGSLAVDDFSLEIADGEFIILVGPSGCGKSTTLNMIAGLEDITRGELRIDGEVVNDKAPKDRDIAMVFQSYALYPHMTVFENMAFPLVLARVDKETIKTKVDEAAEMLELTQHLERKPANLSGGQRQRVAMGRAIVRSPKAFLMDEPLSNLDAKLRVQMRTQVARIQKSLGTTTVYVTHDQTEAMTLGDRVVVMRGGVVQQVGTPTELYEHPRNLFVGGFIGSPSMNFLPATIEGDRLESGLGTLTMPDAVRAAVAESSEKQVIIGLRPEHFEDASIAGDKPGATVQVPLDIVESMGSDVYAYFTVTGDQARSGDLEDLAKDTGQDMHGDGTTVTARLDAAARVRPGQEATLWVDTAKMHVFDIGTGRNLTAETAETTQAVEA
ncbi:sn-glycerol-3-phosphate ABC transporter ATP-binding protein UgpC [Phycicoccus endophyticus]|uniref:sn-glycerol-3-phosphate ABC transporter ATP-binding protein UgpC n=1 Tax=Phycicoccus endophyticus TaxID=1690220 RepID=A0A7G9QYD2_9MICO|nr:sn-glycerol-3-phosphate ABC transporter ATP-binding protein UgpC [Phycicoccus endophyticus]NHI19251.1 sn-glycerol-3-phosphate ABC transporter ATP-binding protein UgpC [Phycicoccus endophyticus]QNN48357.1 sn-glycerol-3-phosphate ABC transporter ATP-binding protein UgpC [Phycicoccus endophyticus]GGL41320.1 ABC transporter ATP-binding protein [Phycicoccus endophyticus]